MSLLLLRLRARPWLYAFGAVCCACITLVVISPSTTSQLLQHVGGCDIRFNLLNPRRRCAPENIVPKKEYEEFQGVLTERIAQWKREGKAAHVSVYFRDLDNGPWFGIEESEEFYPASLLKIPILIATLDYAQANPGFLEREVMYTDIFEPADDNAPAGQRIETGTAYSVHEVLRRMVAYSDNRSKQLILRTLLEAGDGTDLLVTTLGRIGILPANGDLSSPIGVKSYASLFRLLYNSSYLNREYSQLALTLLAESTFTQGIVAGLPPGNKVAHKFGIADRPEGQQLHDCGIIYHPTSPYLLCIMTRNDDQEQNAHVIAEISKLVFDEVTAHANNSQESR